ncbi:hypothetical protein B0J17DRAFT_626036 [Rhizoctonia solani]|nr:hypothetical protein B0J17DRAFT_626036 [Rhizoctonia solani]
MNGVAGVLSPFAYIASGPTTKQFNLADVKIKETTFVFHALGRSSMRGHFGDLIHGRSTWPRFITQTRKRSYLISLLRAPAYCNNAAGCTAFLHSSPLAHVPASETIPQQVTYYYGGDDNELHSFTGVLHLQSHLTPGPPATVLFGLETDAEGVSFG